MATRDMLKDKPVTLDLPAAIANIRRQGTPKRVFHFEHGLEEGIKQGFCDRFDLCDSLNRDDKDFLLRREIAVFQFVGLEFLRVFPGNITWPGFPASGFAAPIGPIQSRADCERYSWPKIEHVDFSTVEWFERNLPDNMAMTAMTYVFQRTSDLLGFAPLCTMLYEDRDLVKAVIEKVGTFHVKLTEALCHFSRFGAINVGDDMGHKTGLLINPDDIRELFVPWQKRIIETAKSHGKLGLFHTCGQVQEIMNDLIDTVGIEAKHSTQDVIEPIQLTKRRYGGRIALLGGVDVDVVTRSQGAEVRGYTRDILDACVPGGGFALGVGNWVADSIPFENYLAMLEEARCFA